MRVEGDGSRLQDVKGEGLWVSGSGVFCIFRTPEGGVLECTFSQCYLLCRLTGNHSVVSISALGCMFWFSELTFTTYCSHGPHDCQVEDGQVPKIRLAD